MSKIPNRLLNTRLFISNSINKLKPFEEVVFIHLILACDEHGRFYSDPELVKGHLFPKRNFTVNQIEEAITALEREEMVRRYTRDGIRYLYLVNWLKYQKPRSENGKYPAPMLDDEGEGTPIPPTPPKAPKEKKEDLSPVFVSLLLNDGTEYSVTRNAVEQYKKLFPSVNVEQELRSMVAWCMSNPAKRKTKSGIARFISNWLSRKQDGGGTKGYVPKPIPENIPDDVNPFK